MIKCKTDCRKCIHRKTCQYDGNPMFVVRKLKNTKFGKAPNGDYDWDIMSDQLNINIDISCPNYKKEVRRHVKTV